MELDSLDFVERISGQIGLAALRAMHDRNVFNDEQRSPLPITPSHPTYDSLFSPADVTKNAGLRRDAT
jgi:hypothetical protein